MAKARYFPLKPRRHRAAGPSFYVYEEALPYQCYSDRLRYLRDGLKAKCELQGYVLLAAWKHLELRLSTTGMLSKSIVYNHHGSRAVQSSS